MVRTLVLPVVAIVSLSVSGCSFQASAHAGAKEPVSPPPPVAAAPAPAPAPAAVAMVGRSLKLAPDSNATVEGTQIKIPGKIEFDVDKATLRNTPDTNKILTTVAAIMKENPSVTKLRVEGHTDDTGTPDHNKRLSQERAEAVAKWLGDHGIDRSRFVVVGMGQQEPLVPNTTEANRQFNRRTEFHVAELNGKAVTVDATAAAAHVPAH